MEKAQIIIHVPGLTAVRSCRAAVFLARRRLFVPVAQMAGSVPAHRAQSDLVAPNKKRLDLISLVDAHYMPYMSYLDPLANGPSRATPDATCFLSYHLRKWTGIDFMNHRLAPSGVSVICYADLLSYVLS